MMFTLLKGIYKIPFYQTEMQGGMTVKKILIVQGGGRANGNTAQLVSHFVKGAEESGHLVEVISLVKNEVKGCLGCNVCRYGKPCVQKDAFNEIVQIGRAHV